MPEVSFELTIDQVPLQLAVRELTLDERLNGLPVCTISAYSDAPPPARASNPSRVRVAVLCELAGHERTRAQTLMRIPAAATPDVTRRGGGRHRPPATPPNSASQVRGITEAAGRNGS